MPPGHNADARLVSYVAGLPLGPAGWNYTNTDYILAQMIIEKVAHDTYADQLTQRIIIPLRLRTTCLAPYTCPAADAARMPAGYFFIAGGPPSLIGDRMPPLALTWAQAAGGIVSSLADMTTWDRDLYQGQVLPARQQHQLESLVSQATGKPIRSTTLADPGGYGLGIFQLTLPQTGTVWYYEGQAFGARVLWPGHAPGCGRATCGGRSGASAGVAAPSPCGIGRRRRAAACARALWWPRMAWAGRCRCGTGAAGWWYADGVRLARAWRFPFTGWAGAASSPAAAG